MATSFFFARALHWIGEGTGFGVRATGAGADAALAATIFHDGHFTLGAARAYLRERAIPVREPRPPDDP